MDSHLHLPIVAYPAITQSILGEPAAVTKSLQVVSKVVTSRHVPVLLVWLMVPGCYACSCEHAGLGTSCHLVLERAVLEPCA
jgi:hypothetical protein